MSGKNINFEDKKIKKRDFYKSKKASQIDDIDVNKISVPKEEAYGTNRPFKYFIGYNDKDDIRPLCITLPNDKDDIRPLCITLPQMIGYVKFFESNKAMSFKVSDNKLLKKYTQIWKKVRNILNIKLDSEPVYGDNDKYIEPEIKIYDGNVNTNFQGKKLPKENASYQCLSLIMLDSIVKVKKKCYPQTLLEECKYEIKKTKMKNLINDNSDPS